MHPLIEKYARRFAAEDPEGFSSKISNADAAAWVDANVPVLELPDEEVQRVWYFRWWTLRKHFADSPEGPVITEFLRPVPWGGNYGTINCASGFHLREGRWLRASRAEMENYIRFWLKGTGDPRMYSSWLPWAIMEYCAVSGSDELAAELYDALAAECAWWEKEQFDAEKGLFWCIDDRDGMELSVGGSGLRPTINSYLYGSYVAMAGFADRLGKHAEAAAYRAKADSLKKAMRANLWRDGFYKTLPTECESFREFVRKSGGWVERTEAVGHDRNARELVGYVPWYFGAAEEGCADAFADLTDPEAFLGKWGLRTCSKASKRYRFEYDHECLWNGPVWPYATCQTLAAGANLLQSYADPGPFTAETWRALLRQYAASHVLRREDGETVSWIDEDQDPETGEWIARAELKRLGWEQKLGGKERGRDYNHSMFCDLVITGLFGVRVSPEGKVTLKPLADPAWEEATLDRLEIRGHIWRVELRKGVVRAFRDGVDVTAEVTEA